MYLKKNLIPDLKKHYLMFIKYALPKKILTIKKNLPLTMTDFRTEMKSTLGIHDKVVHIFLKKFDISNL